MAQIRAPIRQGGMGLPAMVQERDACHAASFFLTACIMHGVPGMDDFLDAVDTPAARRGELTKVQVQMVDAIEERREKIPEDDEMHRELEPATLKCTLAGRPTRGMQARLINAVPSADLLRLGTHRDTARIESVSAQGAQAYLTVVPRCRDTRLTSDQMLISGLMALGLPLPHLAGVRKCCWDHCMDESGRHLVASGCGLSSSGALNGCYKSVRHDRLVTIWVRLIERAGLRGSREPPVMPGMPQDRRADILVHDFPSFGEVTYCDLTVRAVQKGDGGLVQSYQRGVPGSVAAAAVKEKQRSYAGLRGARLEVMVHEQYGRLNEEAVELVKQLAHRETALRLGLGAGEREANPLYGATFGAVLANSRKLTMLSAGLAKQNSEAVIRGYKGATLYADPGGAELESLEGTAVVDFALGGAGAGAGGGGAAGGGVGGGDGSAA